VARPPPVEPAYLLPEQRLNDGQTERLALLSTCFRLIEPFVTFLAAAVLGWPRQSAGRHACHHKGRNRVLDDSLGHEVHTRLETTSPTLKRRVDGRPLIQELASSLRHA